MKQLIQLKSTVLPVRNPISRSPLRLGLPRVQPIWIIRGLLLIPLVLGCLALSPAARAVTPEPDGGYGDGNTSECYNALFSLTNGSYNTAIGDLALESNTTGARNTASGSWALLLNQTGHDNTATGYQALCFNIGSSNTANGVNALYSNRGSFNTANGREALYGSGPSV